MIIITIVMKTIMIMIITSAGGKDMPPASGGAVYGGVAKAARAARSGVHFCNVEYC